MELEELSELLRIPSISSDGAHQAELREAAEWVARLVGDAKVVDGFGNPVVDGLIPASTGGEPTVLAYGHYDVQSPGDADLWESPAFEPAGTGVAPRSPPRPSRMGVEVKTASMTLLPASIATLLGEPGVSS